MNILVCGSCLPRKYEYQLKDLSAAGNQYQNNLIKYLNRIGRVKVLSFINIPVKDLKDDIEKYCINTNIEPIIGKDIKNIIEYRKKLKKMIKWADVALTYNVMYPWFGLGNMMGKIGKRAIGVIADYTPIEEQESIGKKIYASLIKNEFANYQKIVMLSEGIQAYLGVSQEQITINGCIETERFENIRPLKSFGDEIILMYSGLISKVTGIDILLESFSLISNRNIRLVITGKGDHNVEEMVIDYCNKDRRIEYKGFVADDIYIDLLNKATILINPRNMNMPQNKTNFPSKILEYLISGRTVISTKFSGWENYKDFVYFTESDAKSLSRTIDKCCNDPAVLQNLRFESQRCFAMQYSWENQIDKFF